MGRPEGSATFHFFLGVRTEKLTCAVPSRYRTIFAPVLKGYFLRRHPDRRANPMRRAPIAQHDRPRRYTGYTGQTPFRKEAFRQKLSCCFSLLARAALERFAVTSRLRKDSVFQPIVAPKGAPSIEVVCRETISIVRSSFNTGSISGSKNVSSVTGASLSDSGTASLLGREGTCAHCNSLSRHLARNTPWLPLSRCCAMSSRNASAMRSPGVSASKARTNLLSGSMT